MTTTQWSTVAEGGTFYESPRWHGDHWWASDLYGHSVIRIRPGGTPMTVLEVAGQPSGMGWLADGSLLVVSMTDRRVLRRQADGHAVVHADLATHTTTPLNDMVVTTGGHAYVGTFGFDLMAGDAPASAPLLHVGPDGTAAIASEGMYFSNGSVVTPDGRTLIVNESFGNRCSAFTIEPDGGLVDRRTWASFGPDPTDTAGRSERTALRLVPDGATLDAAGCLWIADALSGRCLRVEPGGTITSELVPPEGLRAFACMLGGADGRTMLICCAPDFHETRRRATAEAVLLTTTVEIPHAGLP